QVACENFRRSLVGEQHTVDASVFYVRQFRQRRPRSSHLDKWDTSTRVSATVPIPSALVRPCLRRAADKIPSLPLPYLLDWRGEAGSFENKYNREYYRAQRSNEPKLLIIWLPDLGSNQGPAD